MPREQDRDKFVYLAERRVSKALKSLRLIGNLSNKKNYSYTDEDARKIYKALYVALGDLKDRFETKGGKDGIEFRL